MPSRPLPPYLPSHPPFPPSLAFFALFSFLLCFRWYHRLLRHHNCIHKTSPDDPPPRAPPPIAQPFLYKHLAKATSSFSQDRKLGRGGFGVVYRGFLRDGREVAVKKLDLSSSQGEREFQNELSICGAMNSPHVVKLLGYCSHGDRMRLLVYEYMQNGSLQEALFDRNYHCRLDWGKRFKIIVDVAKALEFLHLECKPPIIHGDVKPSNILLDASFSARIADFGLARMRTEEAVGCRFGSPRSPSTPTDKQKLEFMERSRFGISNFSACNSPDGRRKMFTVKNPLFESCGGRAFASESPSSTIQELLAIDSPLTFCPSSAKSPPSSRELSFLSRLPHLAEPQQLGQTRIPSDESSSVFEHNRRVNVDAEAYLDVQTNYEFGKETLKKVKFLPPSRQLFYGKSVQSSRNGDADEKEHFMNWLDSDHSVINRQVMGNFMNGNEIAPADEKKSSTHLPEQSNPREYIASFAEESKMGRNTHKKNREWWKDEYFADLSSKHGNVATCTSASKDAKGFLWKGLNKLGDKWKRMRRRRFMTDAYKCKQIRSPRNSDPTSLGGWALRMKVRSMKCRRDMLSSSSNGNGKSATTPPHHHQCLVGDLSNSGELVSRDASSTTSMRGTVCYVAPEHRGNGVPSEKSDIYSFGVLMLVILSGRRPIQIAPTSMKEFEKTNLISWARALSQEGKLLELMDEGLGGEYDQEQAYLCITLALLCIQRLPLSRPNISDIVRILSGELPPPPPSLPLDLPLSPPPARIISYKLPF